MQHVSLIIPTYNRHRYLPRILAYYRSAPFKIFIADSTDTPYQIKDVESHCYYLHLPGKSLTNKLSIVLQMVKTPFVVMCADDDFTLIRGIKSCVAFLLENTSYVAVMGNCICYKKDNVHAGKVKFAAMYTDRISFEIAQEDPFERLRTFFNFYRSIFYAVHRTEVLQEAFVGADAVITNLFLNEYLTVILPLARGKVAELPLLYQVREYAIDSGDKTIMNLDDMLQGPYTSAYHEFLDFESVVMAKVTGKEIAYCRHQLNEVLEAYGAYLGSHKNIHEKDAVKRIGSVVRLVPILGKKVIQLYRSYKENKKLHLFLKSPADKSDIKALHDLILKHSYATNP